MVVFGAMSIAGGFLALPLPETRHRPLPDTVEDVEHYEQFCKRALQHEAQGGNGNPGGARNGTELNTIGKPTGTNVWCWFFVLP